MFDPPKDPCEIHVNWEKKECVWCRKALLAEQRSAFVVREYLSADERQKLHYQTGQHFENYSEYRTWCKNNGRRCIEKGEDQDRIRKETAEWVDGGCKGEAPGQWTPDRRRRPSGDEWFNRN